MKERGQLCVCVVFAFLSRLKIQKGKAGEMGEKKGKKKEGKNRKRREGKGNKCSFMCLGQIIYDPVIIINQK